MKNFAQPAQGFGVSWGIAGLRIGRSQYGTWWVSIRLPFGLRVSKRLGRLRDPVVAAPPAAQPAPGAANPPGLGAGGQGQALPTDASGKNQAVLEQMRRRS